MILADRVDSPELKRPSVLTFGVFDGLHLGHQAIMRRIVEEAESRGVVPTVVTFNPHPRSVLQPERAPDLLQTFDQRLEGMKFLGIEQVVALEFTRELASVSAEDFVLRYLVEGLEAQAIYLGRGFAFGRGRSGNIDLLRSLGEARGFEADEVAEVSLRGHRISSTAVRNALAHGRVNLARRMLGRPYGVEGAVVEGRHLGGPALSFPTANLIPHNRVLPSIGVYVTATLYEGQWRRGVTNVGRRPTVGAEDHVTVETHLLDFDEDIYGERIRVRFLHRLRGERKFPDLEALKAQISRDVARTRTYFEHEAVARNLTFI